MESINAYNDAQTVHLIQVLQSKRPSAAEDSNLLTTSVKQFILMLPCDFLQIA